MALTLLADRQYTAPSAANSIAITPTGVAWTNSAYVTVLDPTPAACVLTGVILATTDGASGAVTYDAEVDIATGAAAAEVVIATVRVRLSRVFDGTSTTVPTHVCALPIPIDAIGAGVRVAARLRKNNTNTTAWKVAITYLQKPLTTTCLTTAVAPKALPPAAAGITATAGSPAWASGAWVQLRAATGAALVLTGVVCGPPSANDVAYELDLGIGGAGAETVITTLRIGAGNQSMLALVGLPTPLDAVPAATRLAVRLRCATASATMVVSVQVLEQPL